MSSLLADLAGLAWRRCRGDIIAVYNMWAGGFVAGIVFVVLFFTLFVGYTQRETIGFIGDQPLADAIYYAGTTGVIYTAEWLTVIAILVCIFEYLLNLSIVLYYYDECSWKWVQAIRFGFTAIANFGKQARDANASESRKAKFILKSEILKIKNNNRVL
jgi:uncharacterized membrane protein